MRMEPFLQELDSEAFGFDDDYAFLASILASPQQPNTNIIESSNQAREAREQTEILAELERHFEADLDLDEGTGHQKKQRRTIESFEISSQESLGGDERVHEAKENPFSHFFSLLPSPTPNIFRYIGLTPENLLRPVLPVSVKTCQGVRRNHLMLDETSEDEAHILLDTLAENNNTGDSSAMAKIHDIMNRRKLRATGLPSGSSTTSTRAHE